MPAVVAPAAPRGEAAAGGGGGAGGTGAGAGASVAARPAKVARAVAGAADAAVRLRGGCCWAAAGPLLVGSRAVRGRGAAQGAATAAAAAAAAGSAARRAEAAAAARAIAEPDIVRILRREVTWRDRNTVLNARSKVRAESHLI